MATLYNYGPAALDLIFVRGDDFSMIIDVEGDRDADTFAAALRPKRSSTIVAFTVSIGAYDSGAGTTPVTLSMADTVTDDLVPGEHLWDLEWTSGADVRTIAGGCVTVIGDVTP